jgi:RNA polymerase sigma-70 factor (ECF subfamily)
MGADSSGDSSPGERTISSDETIELLARIKSGDAEALDRLMARLIPVLRRWAHGRLPTSARSAMDTVDLVQDTVISALKRLDAFDARSQGALQAYLRQAVLNRIKDVARYHHRRPTQVPIPEQMHDRQASPLEQAIGAENVRRYEEAMRRLAAADREAIVGRLEMQYDYDELAIVLNKPSAAAARMAVTRAMKRLASEMCRV